jgi:hypothetical protein
MEMSDQLHVPAALPQSKEETNWIEGCLSRRALGPVWNWITIPPFPSRSLVTTPTQLSNLSSWETNNTSFFLFPPCGSTAPRGLGLLIFRGFTITHFRHTTLGRTPLDEWPARRRDLYLTTHNTHKRQTSMPLVGFEPTIPASEQPQTHALDHAATGIGQVSLTLINIEYKYQIQWQYVKGWQVPCIVLILRS